jgi:type II secretory pathway pseudopilin PulG
MRHNKLQRTVTRRSSRPSHFGSRSGFTLAEVLAALVFMAIVIPVAVQGLRLASLAGEVAQRKGEAVRVADRLLNESIVTTNWSQSTQSGTVYEGVREFRWTMHSEVWNQGTTNTVLPGQSASGAANTVQPTVNQFTAAQIAMNLLTVEVTYPVQGKDYTVALSTLVPTQ